VRRVKNILDRVLEIFGAFVLISSHVPRLMARRGKAMSGMNVARSAFCSTAFAAGLLLTTSTAFAAVGLTSGTPSVTSNGTAIYEIPLDLPPGTNGLTPSLSLRYSHTQGTGLFGVGWSLTGLSGINRCNKTWAQDGAPTAATLAVSDGYCLDGNRLNLTSGTYGTGGSTYRTEIEAYARVEAVSNAGNGPQSWLVRRKDGLIYEYGNTTDSRIESVGSSTVRLWALNRIRDRVGNYIDFTYEEDTTNGSFRPDKIRYTGNSVQGTLPVTEVDIEYQTVPVGETDTQYFAGGLIKRITRANRINVSSSSTLVHRYELAYEGSLSSTSKSRLASIQECAGAVPDCYPLTSFSYQNGTAGVGAENPTGFSVPTKPWILDVNGDGREDLVYSSSTGAGTWTVMLALASGGYDNPAASVNANTNYTGAVATDYNADGLEDLLVPLSGGTWWVMLGNASGLAAAVDTGAPASVTGSNARAIDLNGDGYEDLVWADKSGTFDTGGDAIRYRLRLVGGGYSGTVSTLFSMGVNEELDTVFGAPNFRRGVPDFNGDGRGDIIYQRIGRTGDPPDSPYAFNYQSNVLCTGAWLATAGRGASGVEYFGDFNGDQMDDFIFLNQSALWQLRLSRGTSFTADIGAGNPAIVFDWDGDGYDDVLFNSGGTMQVRRATGEGFVSAVSTGIAWTDGTVPVDVNGDGLMDLGYVASGTWRYRLHQGNYPDLLATVTDGFSNTVTFNYAPLTQNSSLYTKGTGSTFPTQEYRGPMYVVSSQVTSDGVGSTFTLTHTYEKARLHLQGRGYLGFGFHKVIDDRNGVRREETFLQNAAEYQSIGALDLLQIRQSDDTFISEVDNTWSKHTFAASGSFPERRFPYVSQQVVKTWGVGIAPYKGIPMSTATTTNSLDSASGLIYDSTTATVEASTANGAQSLASYSTRVYHPTADLTNDTSTNWCLGRPGRTEVTGSHTAYGGGSVTRTLSRTWDATNCRVTQEIIEPSSLDMKVTRDLGFDSWGNVNSDAVTGIGMSARTTTASWGATGRFLASTTNALSQTTNYAWDPLIGTLITVTDPNGIATGYVYDVFGRRTREDRPDGTDTTTDYFDCTSVVGGCLSGGLNKMVVVTTNRDTGNGAINDQWTYLDKFNRPISVDTELLNGNRNRIKREYDDLGRLYRESAPCWAAACTAYWTTHTYDLLNRPTSIARPRSDSDATTLTTTIQYQGLRVLTTDALSKQSTKILNVLGGVYQSIDHATYVQTFDIDGFGNPVRVSDSSSNTLQSNTFNVRGMKTAQTDMDMGSWVYLPNPLGEVTNVRDAKTTAPAWTTVMTYDSLGRMTTRQDVPESATSTFTWGTSAHNSGSEKYIGGLKSMSGPGYSETYINDAVGRAKTTQITSDTTYNIDYAYNTKGTLDTLTYPTSTSSYRLKLQYDYQNGYLSAIKDFNAATTVFWESVTNSVDPRGNYIDELMENGLQTISGYDLVTGLIDSVTTGPGGSATIQGLVYTWNDVGNLSTRHDARQSLIETFGYDNLHRVTSVTGPDPVTVAYNDLGNITSKGGVSYTYHGTKKHAVTAAGGTSYSYDANGNMITRAGASITWSSYNYPTTINSGGLSSVFSYGPNRQRYKQVAGFSGPSTLTTWYVGGILEKVVATSTTHYKHMIYGPKGLVASYNRRSNGTIETLYYTHDHLGSVDSITSSAGAVSARLSYDLWGKRRNESGWTGALPGADWTAIGNSVRKGFTEHEHLDNIGLIHMNGRVYDPIIGRFLSADPYILHPGSTQSFNRYSYVRNNPLSATDPSGFYERGGSQIKAWLDAIRNVPAALDPMAWRSWDFRPWSDPPSAGPNPTEPTDPEAPADPIDEQVNSSTTSCDSSILPCGAMGIGPGESQVQCHPGTGCTVTPISDFAEGIFRGLLDDCVAAARLGGVVALCGGNPLCVETMISSVPEVEVGAPDSNIGRAGYDVAPAVVVLGSGVIGGARYVAGRMAARGAAGAGSSLQGFRLGQQLAAEQAAGVRAPTAIRAWSEHALKQIAGRDGGVGVSRTALENAFASPNSIQYVASKYGPTFRYVGNEATVVVNAEGNVVTGWANSALGVGR